MRTVNTIVSAVIDTPRSTRKRRATTRTLARYNAIVATADHLGFPPVFAQRVWASLTGLTPGGRDRMLSRWEACALTWTPVTREQAAELAAFDEYEI